MANGSKGKVIQMLTPENYIRQKATTLPIHECWVNKGWQDMKMANVIIARKHSNGNITACLYIVDLLLLGIKDSFFIFNSSWLEYSERIEDFKDNQPMETIPYELAHNIIHAGVEFAEDFGFKPHKDFVNTTRFMLEKDDDNIPIIEIETGLNGVPAFLPGPNENEVKKKQIIAQLEKNAGKGYYYILNEDGDIENEEDFEDDFDDDEDYDDDDDDEIIEELERIPLAQKIDMFLANFTHKHELNEEEIKKYFILIDLIVEETVDGDKLDEWTDKYLEEFVSYELKEGTPDDALLGGQPGKNNIDVEVKKQFLSLLSDIIEEKDIDKKLSQFKKNKEVEAAVAYISLFRKQFHKDNDLDDLMMSVPLAYPDYALMQIMQKNWEVSKMNNKQLATFFCTMEQFFGERDWICYYELFQFIDLLLNACILEKDLLKMEALKYALDECDLLEKDQLTLKLLIYSVQAEILENKYLKKGQA